ncbi:MAG: c-type cytochrome [Fuerstiella sp.]|nr:c-type cytochrome [Fuerstiella sp.]MCP4854874.1 c-type cytochrome [Fuerstiella sp.]
MSLSKHSLRMVLCLMLAMASLPATADAAAESPWVVFEGGQGSGAGKHVVLISGDEEYRSEEAMPMLAKILSQRFGFRCTVLFAINKETGAIDPNVTDNIPGLSTLETADLMIVFTRFRVLPDEQMKHVDAYLRTGKPVIGIRPSVVAFRNKPDSKYARYSSNYGGDDFLSGFGRQVLGATWISHHGHHGRESTRGIPVEAMKDHPILRGVDVMWGPTDVYTVRTPIPHNGKVLVMGQVVQGMKLSDPPSPKAQMPLAWVKHFPTPAGNARVFMSTMGDAQDFQDDNFRRMIVNACFWAVGLEDAIEEKTDVGTIIPFEPSRFGFNAFRKGLFPHDYAHLDAGRVEPKRDNVEFKINRGDRICYVGNTLADRMQHFGWLETLVQSRFPEQNLVFRNLGFSADELTVRPRSMSFGDPHSHLAHSKADVVFAFFGYNESFDGPAGLDYFRHNLTQFITDTRGHKYNGKTPPRIVLFSPVAHENLRNPNLPDGSANNQRLAAYTAVMADVANSQGVSFVDLFTPTKALYAKAEQPLTINGIHLTSQGNRLVAEVVDEALFGEAPQYVEPLLDQVRKAVLTKNLRWFNRYRATDGYSTYGQRSQLEFVDGQTNYVVMQHELKMLDVMTANRDRGIWAAAQGREHKLDDSNVPKPLSVKTNIRGGSKSSSAVKEGSLDYLSGEGAIFRMKVAEGMQLNLFASEEQFPDLVNPVQVATDTNGRLWVSAWHTYPHWHPNKPLNDKLLILPDENRDGRADRCIVFADELHNPTGFEFWNGGVLVACAPDILFLKDTDGDDKADVRIRYLHGIDSADTHCGANSFVLGPDGCIYFSEGIFHYTNIETPWGKPLRTKAPMLYRWNPRSGKIAEHFHISPNPHGIVVDEWGNVFATDATSGRGYYVGYPGGGTPHDLYDKRVRPVAGFGMISGTHFPKENRGNLLICNTIGFLGVLQHELNIHGADVTSREIEPIVVSTDGNFRPVDLEIGGDGALYVLDWHNVIIGHMQHNIRDPSRDHSHGRIYRVTAAGRPLATPVKLAGRPIEEVIGHLASPEETVRYRARIELSGRDSQEVVVAAKAWVATLDPGNVEDAHHLLEALWLHEQHNIVDQQLLRLLLQSPHPKARAAATRVLGHWGSLVEDALALLQRQARDEEALVRHEAVVAAASFEGLDAAEVVFQAANLPLDDQLKYAISQTRRSIDKYWQQAIKDGEPLSATGHAFVLRHADNVDLLRMPRSEVVCREILERESIPQQDRVDALTRLAGLTGQGMSQLLLDQISQLAQTESAAYTELVPLLQTLPAAELTSIKPRLATIAGSDGNSGLRSAAIAALIDSGERVDSVYSMAATNYDGAIAYLSSVALVQDTSRRSAMHDSIRPLIFEVPTHLQPADGDRPSGGARYVRIELARKSILTLAEVQVFSQGVNIAPHGKATQSGISAGGTADRAIDGITDGNWSANSATATADQRNPWWEVDLGGEYPINQVTLHNRIDCCSDRLNRFTLTLLDSNRDPLLVREDNPQPSPSADIVVEGVEGVDVTVAAIQALKHIPDHDLEIFADMAAVIRNGGKHRRIAIDVLRATSPQHWSTSEMQPLADSLVSYISAIPPKHRTQEAAESAFSLATRLASSLPPDKAATVRSQLDALRVQVIDLAAVPHRMIYDKQIIAAEAGKPLEIRFSNPDNMPHNFALVQPGSLEELGMLADATGTVPSAARRHYIPRSDKVLVASRLLEPGDTQVLRFRVPEVAGVYPYVCTYPGHWRRMYGALYVVDDLKSYQADPAAYLAGHPLQMIDELLKYSGRNTEWKYDELVASIRPLPHGRSFDVGRTAFTVANCVACHRMNGEGKEFGPDLSRLDTRKFTPEHILRAMLEPSAEINEKFQTTKFLLDSGKIVTGMVVEETATAVNVIVEPLVRDVPVAIRKTEIDERIKSPVSIMPKGLMSKLTREEILDLLAYVFSRGDKNNMLFHGNHKH